MSIHQRIEVFALLDEYVGFAVHGRARQPPSYV